MTGIYLTDLADRIREAGLAVVEFEGWQYRARSSGGFPQMPTAVQWHHTAGSGASPMDDCSYMWLNAEDRPIGNVYLARDGSVWVGAAGAANTAGKGGPLTVSRETIPQDSANSRTFAIEAANNGVGQSWPSVQIDAYFRLSNMLNAWFGNVPGDIFNHHTWAPTRKIDPAVASSVEGPWKPTATTSAGTWNQADVKAEANRRAQPSKDEEPMYLWRHTRYSDQFAVGSGAVHVNEGMSKRMQADGVPLVEEHDDAMLDYVCRAAGWDQSLLSPM